MYFFFYCSTGLNNKIPVNISSFLSKVQKFGVFLMCVFTVKSVPYFVYTRLDHFHTSGHWSIGHRGGHPWKIGYGYMWPWRPPFHALLAFHKIQLISVLKTLLSPKLQISNLKLWSLQVGEEFSSKTSNWAEIQFTWLQFVQKIQLLGSQNSTVVSSLAPSFVRLFGNHIL